VHRNEDADLCIPRLGATAANACSRSAQNLAMPVVPWPGVSWLAGIRESLPFTPELAFHDPGFGGLRSSSAALIASSAVAMRARSSVLQADFLGG
jgi:hypothetical protein